jgi:hypothetical protein
MPAKSSVASARWANTTYGTKRSYDAPMQLRHGGRIELVLESESSSLVRYRAALETATGTWTGTAEISLEQGRVELTPNPEPSWLAAVAVAMLRAEWRARRSPGASAWPRRLTRWRPED